MRIKATRPLHWLLVLPLLSVANLSATSDDLQLVEAVKHQNRDAIRVLLKQRVDVNTPQGDGATALHWAAYRDDLETADLLIRAGANVNAANDLGVTPLSLASANGNAVLVEKLLAAKANPNLTPPTGVSALMVAARMGSVVSVKALLANGANPNAKETSRGQTALMWAVSQRQSEVVPVLLANGADINARSRPIRVVVNRGSPGGTAADRPYVGTTERGGFTPLLFAARQGDLASAELLLAAGADVNDTAPDGNSVLVLASHSGHGALATFLLEKGADPNAAGAGYTALHAAVLTGDLALVKALLAHGANPSAQITQATPLRRTGEDLALPSSLLGATPFFLAAKFVEAGMMRVLVAAGADHSLPTKNGTTPLIAAAGLGSAGAENRRGINLTANKSAAPDPADEETRTLEAVKLVVELGLDVNASDDGGDTALFGAVSKGFTTVVQLLVDRGAKLNVTNKRGQTLLSLTVPRTTGTTATPAHMLQKTAALLRELGAKG